MYFYVTWCHFFVLWAIWNCNINFESYKYDHFGGIRNFIIILQYFIYRYSHPTVTSGARPEYIPLSQQPIMTRPYEHDMSKSYSPGTVYGQATSPGRR